MVLKRFTQLFVLLLIVSLFFALSVPVLSQIDQPTVEPTHSARGLGMRSCNAETLQSSCQPNDELVEISVGNMLRFGRPQGWVDDPADEDASDDSVSFVMGMDYASLDASSMSGIQMTENQQVIAMRWSGPNVLPSLGFEGAVTLNYIVEDQLRSWSYSNAVLLSGPESLTIKDRRAQNFKLSLDGSELTVYIIEVKQGESYLEFFGYAAKGNLDAVDIVIRAMADTVDYHLIVDWLYIRQHRPPLNHQ